MDIVFTIIASTLMLVGFLVICRSAGDYEDEDEEMEEDTEPIPAPEPRSKDAKP